MRKGYGLAANDSYDSASFLLHAEWAALRETLGGAPVVVPIGRDIVLFTGESSRTGLEAMRLILLVEAREPKAPYPITTRPYRWTPEGEAHRLTTGPRRSWDSEPSASTHRSKTHQMMGFRLWRTRAEEFRTAIAQRAA